MNPCAESPPQGRFYVAFPCRRCRLLRVNDRRLPLIWQSHAAQAPTLPDAPAARACGSSIFGADQLLKAPEANWKTREEKRFSRYDHVKDGKVEAAEYLASRHKNFDKLDGDHNARSRFGNMR